MLRLRRCLGGRECLKAFEVPEALGALKAPECPEVPEGLGALRIAVACACRVGGNGSGVWKFAC